MKRVMKFGAVLVLLVVAFYAGVFYAIDKTGNALGDLVAGTLMLHLAQMRVETARAYRTAPESLLETLETSVRAHLSIYREQYAHVSEIGDLAAQAQQAATDYADDFGVDLLSDNDTRPPAPESPETGPPAGRSPASTEATSITFTNAGARPLDVYWLDFEGREQRYFTLAPAQTIVQPTYASHIWNVRDADTQDQIASKVASSEPVTLRIGE